MDIRKEKGIALFLVLAFMLILVIAVISVLTVSISEIQAAKALASSARAFYLAEAGLQQVKYKLINDLGYRASPTTLTGDLGDGSYSASPVSVAEGHLKYTITSSGTVSGLTRRIEQTAEVVLGLEEYVLFFGGPGNIAKETTITGNIFANGNLTIDLDSIIYGDIMVTGDISLGNNTVVNGSVIAGGSITKGTGVDISGDEISGSTLPNEVSTPILVTTYYDGEITIASGKDAGNKSISGVLSEYEGYEDGTIYVNGQADITGSITGPGTIVATGKIVVGQSVGIGSDIKLIAGGNLEADKEHTIGSSCTLYSSTSISLAKEGVGTFGSPGTGSVIITPGTISIAKENEVYGLVYGAGGVTLAKEISIAGTAGSGGALNEIAKEGTYTYNLDFINYQDVNGLTGYKTTANLSDWKEI